MLRGVEHMVQDFAIVNLRVPKMVDIQVCLSQIRVELYPLVVKLKLYLQFSLVTVFRKLEEWLNGASNARRGRGT